ncbi:hypothetical protein RZS08_39310, partial [Arthrospira platensis SPKY1]|nr:hypothetical protein [Arthrospira platensis SPKY1]
QSEEGESDDITRKRMKRERLRQDIAKMSEEILRTRESLSYFKTDSESNPLIQDIKKKIDGSEQKLDRLKQEMADLKKDIELAMKSENEGESDETEA